MMWLLKNVILFFKLWKAHSQSQLAMAEWWFATGIPNTWNAWALLKLTYTHTHAAIECLLFLYKRHHFQYYYLSDYDVVDVFSLCFVWRAQSEAVERSSASFCWLNWIIIIFMGNLVQFFGFVLASQCMHYSDCDQWVHTKIGLQATLIVSYLDLIIVIHAPEIIVTFFFVAAAASLAVVCFFTLSHFIEEKSELNKRRMM